MNGVEHAKWGFGPVHPRQYQKYDQEIVNLRRYLEELVQLNVPYRYSELGR